jgi:hypothetical protein
MAIVGAGSVTEVADRSTLCRLTWSAMTASSSCSVTAPEATRISPRRLPVRFCSVSASASCSSVMSSSSRNSSPIRPGRAGRQRAQSGTVELGRRWARRFERVAHRPEDDVERAFDVVEVPLVQLDVMAEKLAGDIRGQGVIGIGQRDLHDPAAVGKRKQPEGRGSS